MSSYVVKFGGHALDDLDQVTPVLRAFAQDVAALRDASHQVVIAHGGGPQIAALLADVGLVGTFCDGLRVTDAATMRYVALALGYVNTQLVSVLGRAGLACVGLCGADGALLRATSLGAPWERAGGVPVVRRAVLDAVANGGYLPVVSPLALDEDGGLLNCNADTVAGALAASIGADALVLLSDVAQLRADPDDPSSALAGVDSTTLRAMLESGAAAQGMRPKARAALDALDGGAKRVVLASGRHVHALRGALEGSMASTEVTS